MVTRNAEASSSTGPHRMRITSGGCVKTYVSFAIGFLQVSQVSRINSEDLILIAEITKQVMAFMPA